MSDDEYSWNRFCSTPVVTLWKKVEFTREFCGEDSENSFTIPSQSAAIRLIIEGTILYLRYAKIVDEKSQIVPSI